MGYNLMKGGVLMDTRTIGYFMACYEIGSLNRAAGALYISPQGLGKVLDRLEDELGGPLFNRTKQGLVPTESGKLFYTRCSGLLNELQDIKMEIQRINLGENKLRIGYSCGVLNVFEIDRMERFKEKHLLDYTRWTEDYNDEIKERVLRNDLDAAFVIGRINSERIYEEKIFSRPLSAVFYPGHRLYNRESVEMRELEGEKLITLNERFYSYHAIVKRCSETGFTPDIRIKTMEGQLIYKFTAERQGTGIDVDFHRSTPWSQDLRTVEIEDSIPWTVFAVCPVDKKDDPRIKELLDYYRGICLR